PVTDTGNLWVNGEKLTNNADFYEVGSAIDLIHFYSLSAEIVSLYFDAIDIIDGIGSYNHSNIGSVKTQTNLYESDMYKFHMTDVDTLLASSGPFSSGTLGWQTTLGGGNIDINTGKFENPETNNIDSDNRYLDFATNQVLANTYIDRNYGIRPVGELVIYFEVNPEFFPAVTSFGMYLTDFNGDTILSIMISEVGTGILLRVTNVAETETVTILNLNELVKIKVTLNTELEVFSVHSNVDGVDFYTLFHSNVEEDFYNIKFNLYSSTTTWSGWELDNIGIYFEGLSLDLSEMGYGEFYKIDLSEAEGSYAFDGYVHVGTTDPYSISDGYLIENDFLNEVLAISEN
ncbi:hypothetical protein LCGC14_3101840, partial [marine sediment metagenome]